MSDKTRLFMDGQPDHCAALGRLVIHWAHFERKLIHIFELLFMTNIYKAVLIYDEFNSVNAKINLMLRLNHRFTRNKVLKTDVENHLSQALKLNTKRNAFVHAIWSTDNTGKNVVRRKMITPRDYKKDDTPFIVFTVQDIQDVVEEIAKISRSFDFLIAQIHEDQKAQPSIWF